MAHCGPKVPVLSGGQDLGSNTDSLVQTGQSGCFLTFQSKNINIKNFVSIKSKKLFVYQSSAEKASGKFKLYKESAVRSSSHQGLHALCRVRLVRQQRRPGGVHVQGAATHQAEHGLVKVLVLLLWTNTTARWDQPSWRR